MNLPNRKNNRLKNYDYSTSGAYFLTICAKNKRCMFARIVGGGVLDAPQVQLTDFGNVIKNRIMSMNETYSHVKTEKYVIMPNHIHLLVSINDNNVICGNGPSGTPAPTNAKIPQYVSALKRLCNREIGINVWQRSYHDHIIRSQSDYDMIWQYIDTNPIRWEQDCFYTEE